MPRKLVIRLSALGDVAMLIPVLYSVAVRYPEEEFILITKSPLIGLFEFRPPNVQVVPLFAKDKHKGIFGLWKLICELSKFQIDQVADLHQTLRSRQIASFFKLKGKKIATIDKGRKEKSALTRKRHKEFAPLTTSVQRYYDVFSALGYNFPIDFKTIFDFGKPDFNIIKPHIGEKSGKWIGIAPFAKHKGKIYPLEKMEEVVNKLASQKEIKIFLFGGKNEMEQLHFWANLHENIVSVAGLFSFTAELLLMSHLDIMLTMDSGNMHLASLVETPVVSIWGATHPYAGFYGYNQAPENAVQIDLFCRPCSIFGNKPCYRKDYACLNYITSEMIIEKVNAVLNLK